jgi:hypothetical protein
MLISKLMEAGLNNKDIHNIEYLDNKEVLTKLPGGFRWLKRNKREDVIVYFETYADMLEQQLNSAVIQQRRNLAKRRAATVDLPVAELLSY